MVRRVAVVLALLSAAACAGCGYTTKSLLPANIKTVYVPPVVNTIDLSKEVSDKEAFRVYRPGLEVDLTNAIINRFIFDGNLKIASEAHADAEIQAKLLEYRRDALRYSNDDEIQEYRLTAILDVQMVETATQKVIWHEAGLAGDTTFFLAGPHAESEDVAAARLVEDVARRVVEKTVEIW
jgi:hypothetical protein